MDYGHTSVSLDGVFPRPGVGGSYQAAYRAMGGSRKEALPGQDTRYPAFAAAMSDARLVTDYRPQCSKNIAAGKQFYTKHWMIQNAQSIMEESRKRQVEWTGASLPMAHTMPPPAGIVYSTPFESEIRPTHYQKGIGIERAQAEAPPLFGTFTYEPTMHEIQMNRKEIHVTSHMEGGRNSGSLRSRT